MKSKLFKIYILLFGALMTACLEDDKSPLDPEGSQNIVEFMDHSVPSSPSGAVYPAYSESFLLADQDETAIQIGYVGPNDNGQDITITIAVDPVALDLYNTQMIQGLGGRDGLHGTTYELMPEANYSLPETTFTIPAGQKTVSVPIIVYPRQFEFGRNFAVPLRITSASYGTVSGNFGVAIMNLGVRNDYDGIYEITGGSITRHQVAAPGFDPALSGNYVEDLTISLETLSATRVTLDPVWKDGSGIAGIDGTYIEIDPVTNLLLIRSGTNATLRHKVASDNSYDPATRTFTINIEWGTGTGLREINGLKLTYIGPRP